MSSARALEHRLHTLATLSDAVGALRTLSAQHFRAARGRLPAVRAYREEVERLLAVLEPRPAMMEPKEPCGIVLIAADLGLVGDYTARLTREALALRTERGPGPLILIGGRARAQLARAGVQPVATYPVPSNVAAFTNLLLPLVDTIVSLRQTGDLGALWLVAARFAGAGQYQPQRIRVLPVQPDPALEPLTPSPYCGREHLRAVVVREVLYAALYETLLEALASEHGKRLLTTESARSWLDEKIQSTRRLAAAVRREASTQEVLEIASAARAAQRQEGRT